MTDGWSDELTETGERSGEREAVPFRAGDHPGYDTEALLERAISIIRGARPMPLSSSVMIARDEMLELLEEAAARMPEELRAARWLLKEREEYLARAGREADEIIDAARDRAEHMVQRTEVVRAARQRARSIVEAAEAESRRMRREVEDYCDQKLGSFEIVLDRTMKTVRAGREKLQATGIHDDDEEQADADDPSTQAFFDQDQG